MENSHGFSGFDDVRAVETDGSRFRAIGVPVLFSLLITTAVFLYSGDRPDETAGQEQGKSRPASVTEVAFLKDGSHLIVRSHEGGIRVHNSETLDEVARIPVDAKKIRSMAVGGNIIAVVRRTPKVDVWRSHGGRVERLVTAELSASELVFSPDNRFLAIAIEGAQPAVRLYSVETAAMLWQHPVRTGEQTLHRIAFDSVSRHVAIDVGNEVRICAIAGPKPLSVIPLNGRRLSDLRGGNRKGEFLATSFDGEFHHWRCHGERYTEINHQIGFEAHRVVTWGSTIAIGGVSDTVVLGDAPDALDRGVLLPCAATPVTSLSFSPSTGNLWITTGGAEVTISRPGVAAPVASMEYVIREDTGTATFRASTDEVSG